MLDRYVDRPNLTYLGGKYSALHKFCYAEFLTHYYLPSRQIDDDENDNQPEILQENALENNHNVCDYPKTIPLMSSKEKLKCRKVKLVLRSCAKSSQKPRKVCSSYIIYVLSLP